jgi:hypothetical protein
MAKLLKSGLVAALTHAIEKQRRLEKTQGGDGKSELLKQWTRAKDALCSGEPVEIVDSLKEG